MYQIDFYEKEDGSSPIEEFLDSIDVKMRAKIFRIFDMLEAHGPQVQMLHSRYLDDGIFEIQAKQGSDITRVLYFFMLGKESF